MNKELNNFLAIDKLTEEITTIKNEQERSVIDEIHNYLCDYLNNDTTDLLAKGILNGKTMTDAMAYCTKQAQKGAAGARTAMVHDDDVFSWIINYFINDEIEAKQKSVAKCTRPTKTNPKPTKTNPKPAKPTLDESEVQTDIFDYLD